MSRITKEMLVAEISRDTGINRYIVDRVLNSTIDNITFLLSQGKSIQISGFGVFEPKQRAARTGRNPHTNLPVPIPARIVPVFKAGKFLKDAVIKPQSK